jgi:hypothetical protein
LVVLSWGLQDVTADEASLQRQLDEQKKEIEDLKAKVGKTEGNTILDKIKWYGDFRYRHEEINDKGDSTDSRYNRNRIRARIGAKLEVNDEIFFNLRLGSGSADPVSTNQTLGDAWSSKPVWIDRAYIAYVPQALPGFGIGLGKEETPYYKQNNNQLLWDDDLNPEGIYGEYTHTFSDSTKVTGAAGGFWVVERHISGSTTSATDTGMFGVQSYIEHAVGNPSTLVGGIGYFDYISLEGQQMLSNEWSSGSNTTFGNDFITIGSNKVYRMDYNLLELFLGWKSKVSNLPYSVFGSGVMNVDAKANTVTGDKEDTGYIVGATLNKTKKQWDWSLAYDYRHVKADAVVGQFNDSDFLGGKTGGKGHRVSGTLQVHKNTKLVATLFLDNKYDASHGSSKVGKKYNRLQVDIKVAVK